MITEPSILAAIDAAAAGLEVTGPFDRRAILAALTDVETGPWGSRWQAARYEPAYARGGRYYTREQWPRVHRYESLAACSYGPWQLMYPVACELGYDGPPWGLVQPGASAPYVVQLLNSRVTHKELLESYPDAHNTGNDRDRILPAQSYIENFVSAYDEAVVWYAARDTEATG